MSAIEKAVAAIDWWLLRKQKQWLIRADQPEAEGLLNLIDAIQDAAVEDELVEEVVVFCKWRSEWHSVAAAEGWGLFNNTDIRRDEEDTFESDDEAITFVRRLAAAGSLIHQVAIQTHDNNVGVPE